MTRYWCVVPAGGVGTRMKASVPKQYLQIAGKTIAELTLLKLLSVDVIEKVVVAVSRDDQHWSQLAIRQRARLTECEAGKERVDSVLSGLRSLAPYAEENDWVLVHDIARPCVRASDIGKLVELCAPHKWGGLLGTPVADTLKRSDDKGNVLATVCRENIWRAYTPQMFRYGLLKAAIEKSLDEGLLVTDEASAIEFMGGKPLMVDGHADNIKVTRPADLALAEYYLTMQERDLDE